MTKMICAVAIAAMAMLSAPGCGGGGGEGKDKATDRDVPMTTDTPPEDIQQDLSGSDITDIVSNDLTPDVHAQDAGILDSSTKDVTLLDFGIPDLPPDAPVVDYVIPDTPTDDAAAQDMGPQTYTLKFKVLDAVTNPQEPIAGAEVSILDNSTGAATGQTGVTDDKGEVSFELEAGVLVGYKASKDDYVTAYGFDVVPSSGAQNIGMITVTMVAVVGDMIGLSFDNSKGIISGGVYFAQETEEQIGCAVVSSEPPGDVRYFDPDTDMPAKLDVAPMTSKESSDFVIANVPPGPVQVTAEIDGVMIATATTRSFAGGMTNVEMKAETDENPTPPDCQY